MSNFSGRRVPNVSQYLANLNAVPSAQESAGQEELQLADDGLDFLTNTQFFDFDEFHGNNAFDGAAPSKNAGQPYPFHDFQAFPAGVTSPASMSSPPSAGLQGAFPPGGQFAAAALTGEKRRASQGLHTPVDLEDSSRMAAEEDKRRRNTAASARFRVKKKQREQALEKQAKEMSEKVQMLEGKVQQLEMENKWLKELITEKSDVKTVDASLLEKKSAAAVAGQRKPESRTDGVGTDDVEA